MKTWENIFRKWKEKFEKYHWKKKFFQNGTMETHHWKKPQEKSEEVLSKD